AALGDASASALSKAESQTRVATLKVKHLRSEVVKAEKAVERALERAIGSDAAKVVRDWLADHFGLSASVIVGKPDGSPTTPTLAVNVTSAKESPTGGIISVVVDLNGHHVLPYWELTLPTGKKSGSSIRIGRAVVDSGAILSGDMPYGR